MRTAILRTGRVCLLFAAAMLAVFVQYRVFAEPDDYIAFMGGIGCPVEIIDEVGVELPPPPPHVPTPSSGLSEGYP